MIRVLLIEDDDNVIRAVCRLFRQAGLEVDTAQEWECGVQMAQRGSYDVIVADLLIPGGLRLLYELRDTPTPLVLMSDAADDESAVLNETFAAHFVKPVVPGVLLECVQAAARADRK